MTASGDERPLLVLRENILGLEPASQPELCLTEIWGSSGEKGNAHLNLEDKEIGEVHTERLQTATSRHFS